jgi:hypothetical protein
MAILLLTVAVLQASRVSLQARGFSALSRA